jgi:hypothetical protein
MSKKIEQTEWDLYDPSSTLWSFPELCGHVLVENSLFLQFSCVNPIGFTVLTGSSRPVLLAWQWACQISPWNTEQTFSILREKDGRKGGCWIYECSEALVTLCSTYLDERCTLLRRRTERSLEEELPAQRNTLFNDPVS